MQRSIFGSRFWDPNAVLLELNTCGAIPVSLLFNPSLDHFKVLLVVQPAQHQSQATKAHQHQESSHGPHIYPRDPSGAVRHNAGALQSPQAGALRTGPGVSQDGWQGMSHGEAKPKEAALSDIRRQGRLARIIRQHPRDYTLSYVKGGAGAFSRYIVDKRGHHKFDAGIEQQNVWFVKRHKLEGQEGAINLAPAE